MSEFGEDRDSVGSSIGPLRTRSWKNRIRHYRQSLDSLVLESIDEVFADLLGKQAGQAFHDYLERTQRIAREEVPLRLDVFQEALEKEFGVGGETIARTIARRLYTKRGIDFTPISNYKLADYVEAAKSESGKEFAKPAAQPATGNVKAGAALVIAIAFGVYYVFAQSWGFNLVVSSDILFIVVSGACSFVAFLAARNWKRQGRLGVAQLGLFLGIFGWFLGELTWGVYEVLLAVEIPYPSLADVFYLAGYIPAVFGIVFFLYGFRDAIRGVAIRAAALAGLAIIGSLIVFLINPMVTSDATYLAKFFDIAYPALDTVLLVLSVAMLIAFADGVIGLPWFWISFGMILTTMADLAFSFGTLSGWYYSGHPVELLWLWGYLGLALGFDAQRKQLSYLTQ